MNEHPSESQRPRVLRVRTAGGMALATLLIAGTFVGASLSGASHTTNVAGAAVSVPNALTGSHVLSLTVPGIAGDGTSVSSTDIGALSYSWGIANSAANGGRPTFSTFTIEKQVDQASPLLQQADVRSTVFSTVTLSVQPVSLPGDSEVITLTHVRIVSDSNSGSAQGADESVSFSFAVIAYVYTTASGTVITGS